MTGITHDDLVRAAATWVKRTYRCPIVITELVTGAGEIPDVLGFCRGGSTVLIECKVSRADFRTDAKKYFRRNPAEGIGDHRFYLAPVGVLRAAEMPAGWGLLELQAKGLTVLGRSHASDCYCLEADHLRDRRIDYCSSPFTRSNHSHHNEIALMMSLVRRLAGPGIRGKGMAIIDPYTNDEKGVPLEPCAECGGTNGRKPKPTAHLTAVS